MIRVVFNYQESGKWETVVEGAASDLEASQAFAAVVLTCQELDPAMLGHTKVFRNPQKGHIIVPVKP